MRMFSEATKARLQALNEDNLPHVAKILRHTITRQPGGVEEEGWEDGPQGIPCRLSAPPNLRSSETDAGGRTRVLNPWTVILPISHPETNSIKESDRIEVKDPEEGWMRTMEVGGISGPRSNEVMRKVFCNEVI